MADAHSLLCGCCTPTRLPLPTEADLDYLGWQLEMKQWPQVHHKKGHGGRVTEAKHASRQRPRKQKPMEHHQNGGGDAASCPALDSEAAACPVADTIEVNASPLTDADLTDIIGLSRVYIWTKVPSEDQDVYRILGPRRSHLVQSVFVNLATNLSREPHFYHQMGWERAIVDYLDPESELPDLIKAQSAKEQRRGSSSRSSSASSYETDLEDEDGRSTPALQRSMARPPRPRRRRPPGPTRLPTVRTRV
ncbi:uncharacterized protein LOC144149115 [Haemaphysalis longicornis]